jgi:hypothetical protein
MKKRNGFISNSSSSSFVIKKSKIDYKKLKRFLKNKSYTILNDDNDWIDDMKNDHPEFNTDKYYLIYTQSSTENYYKDHLRLLKYLKKYKIKDYVNDLWYQGDGRPSSDEEFYAIKNGHFQDEG